MPIHHGLPVEEVDDPQLAPPARPAGAAGLDLLLPTELVPVLAALINKVHRAQPKPPSSPSTQVGPL